MRRFLSLPIFLLIVGVSSFSFVAVGQDEDETPISYDELVTDDGLSILFPSEWDFDTNAEDSSILLFSHDAIIERDVDAPFVSGDVSVLLTFIPSDYADLFGFDGDSLDEKLAGIVEGFVLLQTDVDGVEHLSVSDVEIIEATDDTPAMAFVTYSLLDTADGMFILWDISDDLLGSAIVATATGELADSEAVIMTIVQSIEFSGSVDALLGVEESDEAGDS